jgi:O-acetylserine/cysteine efflux transporter
MLLTQERLRPMQWVALGLAVAGIAVIALNTDGSTTLGGLAVTLVAAASWAAANTVSRRAGRVDALAYVVWSSVFAVPPLLALSWLVEGGGGHRRRPAQLRTPPRGAAVLWQSVGNTLFGFAAWGWLLARHPAATVSPMALLVPVFGIATAAWWMGEPLPGWKLVAAALVIGGLALNLLQKNATTR